jgi:hypothetical protein
MRKLIWGVLLALAVAAGGTKDSSAGGWGNFAIHNQSNYIITGFYTDEGDGWSANWLREQIGAGDSAEMQFTRDGPCDINFRVGWLTTSGGEEMGEPWQIDICNAHNVYFSDSKVTYD